MRALRALVLIAAFAAASASCNRGGDDDSSSSPSQSPGPESHVLKGSSPVVVLTFNVAFAENVPLPALQAMATKFETANQSLWNVTEGQVRIGRIRITDNAHPGSKSNQYDQLNLSSDDIVVWAPPFDGPGIAYVIVGKGRFGRFMGIPSSVANTTLMHELGHFLWELSWSPGPVLIDEYSDKAQVQDDACMMELTYTPLQWCSPPNHLQQEGQPHSCWSQILIDYPDFNYTGTNVATPPTPPAIEVEITDVP